MSRKKVHRKKRKAILETKYQNPLLSKFIRIIMRSGKLSLAERKAYAALDLLETRFEGSTGLEVFLKALGNVRPLIKVKARRVGGSTYQVPVEVSEELGYTFAMRWVLAAVNKKSGKSLEHRLCDELADAFEGRGDSVRKKEEAHKMAESNRAYAHYRV